MKKPISDLTMQAKNGDIEAKNQLLEQNYNLISKFAIYAYNEIKKEYMIIYNIPVDDEQFELPNNIISLDDIIQDLYIRAIAVLNNYLKNNVNLYFNKYLNNLLSKYTNKYISIILKRIINKNVNETNINFDYQFEQICQKSRFNETKEIVLNSINNNRILFFYKKFIMDIFDGNSYNELSSIYQLDKKRINMKIMRFGQLYNQEKNNIEEDLSNCIFNKNINEFDCLLNKNIINIILKKPYYQEYIKKLSSSIFNEIGIYFLINYNQIENDLCFYISDFILNNNVQKKIIINEFNNLFFKSLEYSKKIVIDKIRKSFKISSNDNYHEFIINLISNGNIDLIPLYKNYFFKVVSDTYNKIIGKFTINYDTIYHDFYLYSNSLITYFYKNYSNNFYKFNDYYFTNLLEYENLYIKKYLENENKKQKNLK